MRCRGEATWPPADDPVYAEIVEAVTDLRQARDRCRCDAFGESAHPEISTQPRGQIMNFSGALNHAKAGSRIQRSGWNGKNMHVELVPTTSAGVITEPFLAMRTAQGGLIPWLASQADLLAEDWSVQPDA
jgi:hypothetical protein